MPLSLEVVQALRALAGHLSPAMGARVRGHMADSFGIALAAGHETHLVAPLLDAAGCGGAGMCRVIGTASSLPPAQAAFANSALAHALDYDDIHDLARLHPTTVSLPAALAAADLAGAPGSAVQLATALGNELTCRLGVACAPKGSGPGSDWFLTQLVGYFGATFAAGQVLDLSDDQMVSALGFAYMQAAGGKEAGFGVGSNARAIYPAFAAMGGVTAALLARAGLIGPATALDGAAGFFHIYLGGQPARLREVLLDSSEWVSAATSIKPWPCCRLSHPYVAVALALRERRTEVPIERIVVAVNASAAKLCRPLAERCAPQTLQDAKYSIPFMVAFTLVHGAPGLRSLNAAALRDPAVLALAARIEIDERLPDGPGHPPAEIELVAGGQRIAGPTGLSFELDGEGIRAKFLDCLAYAGAPSADAAARWDRVAGFEGLAPGEWWNALRSPVAGTAG